MILHFLLQNTFIVHLLYLQNNRLSNKSCSKDLKVLTNVVALLNNDMPQRDENLNENLNVFFFGNTQPYHPLNI